MCPYRLKSVFKKLEKLSPKLTHQKELKTLSFLAFFAHLVENRNLQYSYLHKAESLPFIEWKKKLHEVIYDSLSVPSKLVSENRDVEFHGKVKKNGIEFSKISLDALKGLRVPAILCIPENNDAPPPLVICCPGHGQSKEHLCGLKRSKSKEYFGYELAKRGVVTISLDWIGLGEREKRKNKLLPTFLNEGLWSNWVRFIGIEMMALRVKEVQTIINYAIDNLRIDASRIGIMGHSGGGTLALFSSIMDKRIKVCCISGYFGTWQDSILAMYHCGCNYLQSLGKEMELYDLYASLAPRPLGITIGKADKIYPFKGTQKAIPIIRNVYDDLNSSNRLMIDVQNGGHRFYGEKLYPFMLRHL